MQRRSLKTKMKLEDGEKLEARARNEKLGFLDLGVLKNREPPKKFYIPPNKLKHFLYKKF